jgi:hypothetical protein
MAGTPIKERKEKGDFQCRRFKEMQGTSHVETCRGWSDAAVSGGNSEPLKDGREEKEYSSLQREHGPAHS